MKGTRIGKEITKVIKNDTKYRETKYLLSLYIPTGSLIIGPKTTQ